MIKSDLALSVGKGCHTCLISRQQPVDSLTMAGLVPVNGAPSPSWAVLIPVAPLLSLQEGK